MSKLFESNWAATKEALLNDAPVAANRQTFVWYEENTRRESMTATPVTAKPMFEFGIFCQYEAYHFCSWVDFADISDGRITATVYGANPKQNVAAAAWDQGWPTVKFYPRHDRVADESLTLNDCDVIVYLDTYKITGCL